MRVVALHPHSLGASTAPLLRSSRARHVVGLAGVLGYVLLWRLEEEAAALGKRQLDCARAGFTALG